jgi:hypothetical protein
MRIRVKSIGSGEGTLISENSQTSYENPVAAISAIGVYLVGIQDSVLPLSEESRGYAHEATGIMSRFPASFADSDTPTDLMIYAIPHVQEKSKEIDACSLMDKLEIDLKKSGRHPLISNGEAMLLTLTGESMRKVPLMEAKIGKILLGAKAEPMLLKYNRMGNVTPIMTLYLEIGHAERAINALCDELF